MNKRAKARSKQAALQNSTSVPLSSMTQGTEYYEWLTGGLKSAGVVLNERTVMCVSAVYACVQLIAGAIASLPFPIYQRGVDGERQRAEHDVWILLNQQTSPLYSAATFWEYISGSKLLHGDGFAQIHRVSRYLPGVNFLEPLHPLMVDPIPDPNNRHRLVYRRLDTGEVIDQDDMLHFTGMGFNGRRSLSPLRYALKYSAGIALAADEFSADFFSEGNKPEFVIKTENTKLDNDQKRIIQDAWADLIAGNRRRPGVLGKGMDIKELTLSAEDAQLIATRQFQVEDIARIYGVPPFMIGHTANTTSWGTGIEQMGIGFVKYTLSRHLVKIEQECNRKLLLPPYFCEFLTAGLERGDTKGRFDAYRVALGRAGEPGWMTVNEVRKLENQPPVDGGNTLNTGTPNAPTNESVRPEPSSKPPL